MSKQEELDPIVYRVALIRQDLGFEPLYVLEDMDKTVAVAKLKSLVHEWQDSVEHKRPFNLVDQLRAFTPSLIVEIRIDQMPYSQFQRINSQYEKQMRENGTTSFMQNNFTR